MSSFVAIDHDPVIICPYDANHKIARSRIQRHLVKCEKNFPPNFKKQCPYDATHRVFEHELVQHVKHCPMKYTCPIDTGTCRQVSSDEVVQKEIQVSNDEEIWDEDLLDDSKPNEKFVFENSFKQKSDIVMVKHYSNNNKLRRPFGYSESFMLEIGSTSPDEDAHSVTSDMGTGRGRGIPAAYNGQYSRGSTNAYRKGIRGRLLP